MIVTIVRWDEINSKSDAIRTPNWFRINQEIGISQSLFDLTSAEKWVWILLLSTRCKSKKQNFEVNVGWFCSTFNVSLDDFLSAIKKLSDSGTITVDCQSGDSELTPSRPTYIQNIHTEHTVAAQPSAVTPRSKVIASAMLTGKIWEAYSTAYFSRYGTEPVRNAKVNGQIGQLAKRLGEEAPDVVRFYVSHSKSFYVQKAHEIGLCLSDAEGLRTQWATGTKITNKLAQQTDAASALGDQIKRIREGKL